MPDSSSQPGFVPSGYFVLRQPLLPFRELLEWIEGAQVELSGNDLLLESALDDARATLRERLRQIYERPEIREALFLASPDLHERIGSWLSDPQGKKGVRIELALVRYFLRMSSRATPFGLFAGCSIGRIGDSTNLEVESRENYQRHTRLDMDYLCALAAEIEKKSAVRQSLSYRPNSSLYRLGERIRYAESQASPIGRAYQLVGVESTQYLLRTLERAEDGASLGELAAAIVVDDPEVEPAEAEAFVETLVENQILVSNLEPQVTGPEPIHALIDKLECHDEGADAATRLAAVRTAFAALDRQGIGVAPGRYRKIAGELDPLPVEIKASKWLQVDMIKPAPEATLGGVVLEELERAVPLLQKLAAPPFEDPLELFRQAFTERYDAQEVPLVEALDEEAGLGFDSGDRPGAEAGALLRGIPIPGPTGRQRILWEGFERRVLNKMLEARTAGANQIEFTEAELDGLWGVEPRPLPAALDLGATVVAPSREAAERGEFRVLLQGGMGPSGARFLGRFCHIDEQIDRSVRRHLAQEEALHPQALTAEVVHLPEDRLGNVLSRPVLRTCEIPYLGRSGAPREQQVPVTDLTVCVRGDRVVLRSRRLDCEILPRLTTAHNYSANSLPIYRFLCSLQTQNTTPALGWVWGPFEGARTLPRVVSGRLVLSRARWGLDAADIRSLVGQEGAARHRAVQTLRKRYDLPRFVYLADGDNELLIDFDNVLAVDTWLDAIRTRDRATLIEMLPTPDELPSHGPEGRFVHELLIPFVRTEPVFVPTGSVLTSPAVARRLLPGSDWLYAKLYCGSATVDRVLQEAVRPLVASLQHDAAIDRWFFIRFRDPEWHLRLRFQGDPGRLLTEVLPRLSHGVQALEQQGLVWRMQLDTYERELGRYGGPLGTLVSEQLFQFDSEAALSLLAAAEEGGGVTRWQLAVLGMDRLLCDLRLDFQERCTVVRRYRDDFATEFRANKATRIALGERFRRERGSLERLIDGSAEHDGALAAYEALRVRSDQAQPIVEELIRLERTGGLSLPRELLAGSYLHMFANRLLRSAHRMQELALYDFLDRLYTSRAAREKTMAKAG